MTLPHNHPADRDSVEEDVGFDEIADSVCERLGRNQRVRRNLPGQGRLRVDRQLPFLCIYRSPCDRPDAGTRELITTEAAYLFGSGKPRYHAGLGHLCQRLHETMAEHFGTFLFLEVWAQASGGSPQVEHLAGVPAFEIVTPDPDSVPSTLHAFAQALSDVTAGGHTADVSLRRNDSPAPPGLEPLSVFSREGEPVGCCVLGQAVKPIYRDPETGALFPLVLQRLRWQLASALRKAVAKFTGTDSGTKEVHYDTFGPSSLVEAARRVDQEICEVADSFDFLLQVTPTNADAAWQEFSEGGYRSAPVLQYRPLPYHPNLLKRRLFGIEIERIEDPTLAHLCWEKQDEIGRQLTALRDIGTPEFLYNSLQLYGEPDEELVEVATAILDQPPQETGSDGDGLVTAGEFAERARKEIAYYHRQTDSFAATVEICEEIASGVMVSKNKLLISTSLRLRQERVEPLLHHEIGTHLLTYFNGRSQPFRQLRAGLAGYEELQEGLAVIAEYLCGGLSANRLRTLAGRVMAIRSMIDGATFPHTFAELHEEFGFTARRAFITTLRAYRGGGFTKDSVYLRGLRDLLHFLSQGHDLEPLYVGKIGLHHLPYVQEMRRRGILHAPSALPRLWDDQHHHERLECCRGLSPMQLLESSG